MVSFSTYLRGRPSLAYPRVIHAVLSGEVPHGYTTLKSERELEENLMGLLRARTRKACPMPREHGPVNWYSAPLSLEGVPFRFPWSQEFIRKAIRASTSAGPPVDPLYCFKCIAFPNRYWKEPLGLPRAKPVGRAPEIFNRQIQHLEPAQIPGWIEGAAQIRQRNLQSRVIPFPRKSAWKPTGKMTMSGDMSIVQHGEISSVLGSTERARWEEYCLELKIASFIKWKRACELWSQPGWISRRVALAVESRAEIARQQAFAPTMLAPTMAMSLNRPISQPITINLPTHNLEPEPVGPSYIMAYYPNNTVPIPTTGPHSNRSQELPARAQRTNQVQYVEERLRNGLSPLAVAGVAALLTQLDTMQTLPGVSVSLVTEVAGYRRTLTCQNNAWDGHDLTHQFLDERSTTMLGPSQGTRFEQEASLCMVPASVATMPPPQMVALPRQHQNQHQ